MSDLTERINKNLEKIAMEIVTLEGRDIPVMGNMMNSLCEMEKDSREVDQPSFLELTLALKGYLEKMILDEEDNAEPLEEGIECLQSIYRCLINKKIFNGDLSQIFSKLLYKKPVSEEKIDHQDTGAQIEEDGNAGDEKRVSQGEQLNEDDREILEDFIMESKDNLDAIENGLMTLEQSPEDQESINAIFRSFHTIKGVSAFLNLLKINKLAHSAENLLDKARSGEIRVEGTIVDIILESTDMLREMIQDVQDSLGNGGPLNNKGDIHQLIERINKLGNQEGQMEGTPIGEILVKKGAVTTNDLKKGLEKQKKEPQKKIGEILVEEKKVTRKEVTAALNEQKKISKRHVEFQVKVDTLKLDNLVELTGELVIAQTMLKQNPWILSGNDQKLYHNLNQLTQITTSLQTTAMSMRMVPIKNTFQKMVRLVRDLAKNSGKEIVLKMSGEETEIDRNVVEELYEPMVHMIRNAADHGIEPPDEREKSGKDRKGTIHLNAYHRGGNIIVEISDDGYGLDKDRIIEKARSSNLITDESKLTDFDIYNLIFQPGFSTAKEVTAVSGRGVGMDVVKKAIEKMRGRVEIDSTPGYGSKFIISLPLTLAIIEGMVARVGEERYIFPALAILESFRPDKEQYSTVEEKGEMIMSRGKLMPMIRLNQMFSVRGDSVDPWDGLVVSVEYEGEQMCLLIDELLGKEEVVIKSLGENLKNIKGIAGGAIMGDGRVGLILDMSGIFEVARQ